MTAKKDKHEQKFIARNKKAYHDYFVEETYEAGIELAGTEVKSLRLGKCNLKDSYCDFRAGEIFAVGVHISPYEQANIFNKSPLRDRRLLMHKREIIKLFNAVRQDGLTVVPLSAYFSGRRVKLEIGLCRGKKLYDKRAAAAERDAKRTIDRKLKERNV